MMDTQVLANTIDSLIERAPSLDAEDWACEALVVLFETSAALDALVARVAELEAERDGLLVSFEEALRDSQTWEGLADGRLTRAENAECRVAELEQQLAEARETNSKLNRRATQAEAVVMQTVEDCRRQGVSIGRGLANVAATHEHERAEAAEARAQALTDALERIARGIHLEDHDYTGPCNGRCAQKIARAALAAHGQQEPA